MLQVSQLTKAYPDKVLFSEASFTIEPRERIALVGRNGYGKSTLFKLLLKQEHPDEGEVAVPKGYRIGSLAQTLKFSLSTVKAEAAKGLAPGKEDELYRVERLLSGLGFSAEMQESNPLQFSGGFQLRIELAKALLAEPDMLLLDEPTNYLDIVSLRWLEAELRNWPGELVMISHDRGFLDAVCTHSMIIHRGEVIKKQGGVAKLLGLIELQEESFERTRQNEEKARKKTEDFVRRFRAQASKAALVQSRIKQLERQGTKEQLQDEARLDFEFRELAFRGKNLMELRRVGFGYSEHEPLFSELVLSVQPGDVIGVIGRNGKGKSTLLRILAGELEPRVGEVVRSTNTEVGYFAQTNVAQLDESKTVEQEIMAINPSLTRTQVRSICGQMLFGGMAAEKQIGVLSGGERSRVLLGRLLAQPLNLLLLDEPTSHFDLESVEALTAAIRKFAGAVILVTHSELLLREVATRLVVFREQGAEIVEGTYDYFLEKFGWETEQAEGVASSNNVAKHSYAGLKQQRALERKRKKQVESLESEFESLEKQLVKIDQKLCDVAGLGDFELVQSLSAERELLNERIGQVIEELDELA